MYCKLVLFVVLFSLLTTASQATELNAGFGSRYVSEGRNQLSSGGIYWVGAVHNINENMSLGIAYGLGSDSTANYDELNLSAVYSNSAASFDYTLAYTRLEFFKDNASDDELSLSIAYTEIALFTPLSNLVYSVAADGAFIDIGGEKEFQINRDFLITPYILVAYDFGYANGQEEGYNHTSIGVSLNYIVSENISITALAENNIGGSIIQREGAKTDQFHSGIYLSYIW